MREQGRLTVKRRGLARILFRFVHPMHARAASVDDEAASLAFSIASIKVPFGEIDEVQTQSHRRWRTVRIRAGRRSRTISGLSRRDANALVDALDGGRIRWWRLALDAQADTMESICARLKESSSPSAYWRKREFFDLKRLAEEVARHFPARWPEQLAQASEVASLQAIREFLDDPEGFRNDFNSTYIENELSRSRQLFDRIEAQPLTDEQRRAVVVDEERNLVVAAAGSGKTSVIVAKAAWLVRMGFRRPSELLLLAFAKDAQQELRERVIARVGKETAKDISVRTFHSLGMSIIGQAEGKVPTLARAAEDSRVLLNLMQQTIQELVSSPETAGVFARWFRDWFAPYKGQDEFETYGDYWDYIRRYEIRSLNGEEVKSFEECEIANFLYLNGIPYEYERCYEHDTATTRKRQYQPDFYLTDADIYIEHFALSASGRTPPFIDEEEYVRSMEWKRQLHAEHGTTLVETFSHEQSAGRLLRNLEAKLEAHGVALSPLASDRVFEVLNQQNRIGPFAKLVATFLQHYKGSQLSFEDLAERAVTARDRGRAAAFLQVFQPIFERYEDTLSQREEIDFHDMIARATDLVRSGRYRSPFGYVLVDEFQDISPARAGLLKALLEQAPNAQLFAVGDDWQAIFRFAGSDIAIMREFQKHFGYSERLDLETTFRCSDRINAVATKFVLRNPSQIRKKVRSTHRAAGTSVHIGLSGEESVSPFPEALRRVAQDAAMHSGTSDVLLLGRYRHQRPANLSQLGREYPGLRFSFMTAHGSKGSQADYIVVLDLCAGRYGFPSEIDDDPLLDLVLAAPEEHPNAEERRLFYVAMTRAKRQVYLLAEGDSQSSFMEELIEDGYDITVFGRPPQQDVHCPTCVKGRLERRENARSRSTFYGCSNYPYCGHTQRACPVCGTGLLVEQQRGFRCRNCGGIVESCPSCDGWLQTRIGKYGRFLGCSNYPDCNYTRDIGQTRRSRRRAK